MTPLIPEFCRIGFSRRTLFARVRIPGYFFLFVLLLCPGSSVTAAVYLQSSQDPNAKPAQPPTAQQPPPVSPTPSPAKSNDSTPLKKAVRQKKVITDEDLTKPPKPISLSDLEVEENNAICDLNCEAQLRAEMGFGPEREVEFQNQLTFARHEIIEDKVWNYTLQSALQAAGDYCDIQRQKAKILGNGIVAQYTRDSVNSRFAEREQKLILEHRNLIGLLTQHLSTVQRFASFRATVMERHLSEATARVCPDYKVP
jgi:hypothetical protein